MNNRQRRAAKATRRHQRTATPPRTERPSPGRSRTADPVGPHLAAEQRRQQALNVLAMMAKYAAAVSMSTLPDVLYRTVTTEDPAVLSVVEELLVGELMARISVAWEHGWQPQDLRHGAVKRNGRQGVLAAELIIRQALATRAHGLAPKAWQDQLDRVAETVPPTTGDWRPVVELVGQGVPEVAAWADVLGLLKMLAELPALPLLMPPPSKWGSQSEAAAPAGSPDRDRVLARIRALLAKAEATDHPAEAETFTAKAQELMSKHAIDDALLHAHDQESVPVLTRRVHLSNPYASTKVLLLSAVAQANRARAIYLDRYAIAFVVGTPVDVDQVELLFTSLLIQATRAMSAAGQQRAGSFDRSPTFRRSFLTAYASRIGERLTEANRDTVAEYGAELVPVLKRQAMAVEEEFTRHFPHTTISDSGTLDGRGWQAGREAGDRAVFVAGRLAG